MAKTMTFWQWIRSLKGAACGQPEEDIVKAINTFSARGTTFPTGDPQSFEEVKDALMVRGFTRAQLKATRVLWSRYKRFAASPQ